jgi:hypothetical protein
MKSTLAIVCLSLILTATFASAVFAQDGMEKNAINAKIDGVSANPVYIPYGNTTTITATLNNTSPYLSGTVQVDAVAPAELAKAVNISDTQTVFLGVGQASNVTLTIRNAGNQGKTANGTFTLKVTNAGYTTTDVAKFELSLGPNPNFNSTAEQKLQANSTLAITCLDSATNNPISEVYIEVSVPKTAITVSGTTNTTGQCILNLGTYTTIQGDTAYADSSDPAGQYLPASQSLRLTSENATLTFYLKEESNGDLSLVAAVAAVAAVSTASGLALMVYRNKTKKPPKADTAQKSF